MATRVKLESAREAENYLLEMVRDIVQSLIGTELEE